MSEIIYKELSYKINGLLFKTHKALGAHRNEKQYGDFFEQLLKEENIIYSREFRFKDLINFEAVDRSIIDFLIDNKIVVEFKVKSCLKNEDYDQVKRYLTTLDLSLGLLVNFRQKYLTPKRILKPNNN
jgi:GxxExxY protein